MRASSSPARCAVASRRLGIVRLGALLVALALALQVEIAGANRFGPPWQAEVIVEQTVARGKPDESAPPVGPLRKGNILVVLDDADGWTRTPVGFVSSADIREKLDPWIGEIKTDRVELRAKPNASSPVRRTVERGALVRVLGASPGLEEDSDNWWATTDGYAPLGAIDRADVENKWAREWRVPTGDEAAAGWWGRVVREANVRAGASREAPIVGEFVGGERVKVLAEDEGEEVAGSKTWLRIDGGRYAGARLHSSLVERIEAPAAAAAPEGLKPGEEAIVVDRRATTLTLVRDGQARFTTYVALGKAGRDTPAGEYTTFGKFRADDMTSASVPDAERPYDLPNAPFAQYYKDGGFALHGTYWHDAFGSEESQGCINLTWGDAAFLFGQTRPELPAERDVRWAGEGQATRVVIRD